MLGRTALLVVVLVVLAAGCPSARELPLGDASFDGRPPRTDSTVVTDTGLVPLVPTDELDVLFVIDNSGSLTEEQASFAMQIPRFVQQLDARYRSVHFGVVTTDMGVGGFRVPTCREPNFGDDGVLRTTGNTSISGCEATYPSFLDYRPGVGDAAIVANDLTCISVTGILGGCGFEQPLEALLKATTPSTQPPTGAFDGVFSMGTTGHADRANSGFLRPDANLAVVILSDEEDCSARDPEIFNPDSSVYPGDLNLRCFVFPEAVQPVERYTDGLTAGRDPRRLRYFVIAGVPRDASGAGFDEILAHPDMQEMIDPDMPTRLRPSCNVAGRGFAFAPRRMVELGRQLDARGATASALSICQADFTPVFDAILEMI